MTRTYQSRQWSPARSLCVLDLNGRLHEMIRQAERRGCTDHHELLVEFQADLAAATSVELERADACLLLDRLVEDAEVLVTAFEAMEDCAATIAMTMELEGIVDATTRVRGAYEGGRRNRTAGRIRWRVSIPAERNHSAEIERRLDDVAPAAVEAAPK